MVEHGSALWLVDGKMEGAGPPRRRRFVLTQRSPPNAEGPMSLLLGVAGERIADDFPKGAMCFESASG